MMAEIKSKIPACSNLNLATLHQLFFQANMTNVIYQTGRERFRLQELYNPGVLTSFSGMMTVQTSCTISDQPASSNIAASSTHTAFPADQKFEE